MQLESRKNSIEIELNERLRRRREELRAKMEALGERDNGDSSSAEDLDNRVRELKTLNNSIEALIQKAQGVIYFLHLIFALFR